MRNTRNIRNERDLINKKNTIYKKVKNEKSKKITNNEWNEKN